MNRRTWILNIAGGIASSLLVGFIGATTAAHAATPPKPKDRLDANTIKMVLLVGRPEDKAFIDQVVALREAGKLKRETVQKCFLWARKKSKNKFHYFKFAIIQLAAKEGVKLKNEKPSTA